MARSAEEHTDEGRGGVLGFGSGLRELPKPSTPPRPRQCNLGWPKLDAQSSGLHQQSPHYIKKISAPAKRNGREGLVRRGGLAPGSSRSPLPGARQPRRARPQRETVQHKRSPSNRSPLVAQKSASGFQVPQVVVKEERRVLYVRERRFERRDGVPGTRAASSHYAVW